MINLDKQLLELNGKESKDAHMGQILANDLIIKTPGIEPAKAAAWAMTLWKKEPLDIDKTDSEKLVKYIESAENLINLAKAQLIETIKNDMIKTEEKKKKKDK